MIQVTLLGTAALLPLPERALSSAHLVCGGHSVLFDCGEGTQTAARKAGVSLFKTDVIALTHYHGDHIFGLPGLLQTLNAMGRTEPLYIIGPGEIERELESIVKLAGWLAYELRLLSVGQEGVILNDLSVGWPHGAKLIPIQTNHRVESQGYVFELPRAGMFLPEKAKALGIPNKLWGSLQKGQTVHHEGMEISPNMVMGSARKGLRVVFSGDTAQCDALTAAAKNADLLICDATYGENNQAALAAEYGHMNFAQAAQTAAESGARRLWLAHYSQMIGDPKEYLENAAAIFPEAQCGTDGMQIILQFEN